MESEKYNYIKYYNLDKEKIKPKIIEKIYCYYN